MKRATLVDPSLLAAVEQESPAVFANYSSNPISRFTFVDYSMDEMPMLIRIEAYEYLQSFAKINFATMDEVLEELQVAYDLGFSDLYTRLNKAWASASKIVEVQYILLSIALNKYPLHDFDRFNKLLDAHIDLDSVSVKFKTAYMDAIYFESWKRVLQQHEIMEEHFMKINLFKLKNIEPEDMKFSLS